MPHNDPILYLIRHGEKPPKQSDGEDGPGLSTLGVDRSQALVKVFGQESPYNIGYIIAQEPKKNDKQTRPYLTVKPLADSLAPDVPFKYDIDRDHVKKVADAVQGFQGPGNILICWEHDTLEKIAKAIGVNDPPEYPGDRFDIIWTIKSPYEEIESITSEHCPGIDDKYANEP